MPRYAVFGVVVESELALPELGQGSPEGDCDWRIERRNDAAPVASGAPLGSEHVYGDVQVRAVALAGGIRLVFDDTGTFDVLREERVIVWYPGSNTNPTAVRADLLGRVMAVASHADGHLVLHASAVSIDGRAVAFLGDKHAGKSTLALALVRQGARLLTDDTLVILSRDGRVVLAAPGVQRVRLWDDSARALSAAVATADGAKPTVEALGADALQGTAVPLAAGYVLTPVEALSANEAVRRDGLRTVHATLACVRFSKLGALAGGSEAATVLDRCAALARRIPMYSAEVSRDLSRVEEAAATFMAWHRQPASPNGSSR